MKRILILMKWRYLRWVVRREEISFRKFMARMYWIQELSKLPQHEHAKLVHMSARKLRRLFAREYPDAHLHDPGRD